MAQASLIGAFGGVFGIIGSGLAGPMCIKYSQIKTLYIGNVMMILGLAFSPLSAADLVGGWGEPIFYVGLVLLAVGAGIQLPASTAILSSRVAFENQGKFFSGLAVATFTVLAGTQFLYTQVIVTSTDD